MSLQITVDEVIAQYRKAISKEIPVTLADPQRTWEGTYAGDVQFMIGDWKVTFFNDCDELDYTDSVETPDGRKVTFEEFCYEDFIGCPLDWMDYNEQAELEQLLYIAK
jgi:hypothetical protein